jgi:16S rRNA (guanine527-N7)-methyltransferase
LSIGEDVVMPNAATPSPEALEPVTPGVPPTPRAAKDVFGEHVTLAERYVALLGDTGIAHGLIGPREAPRLWDRHVLNCAVVAPYFSDNSTVIDLGSGAGLPGLVFAIARPDLTLHLVEPLTRRCRWLEAAVAELGLTNVVIHNVRAEGVVGVCRAPYVTARAVARIDALARWSFPLLEANGRLVALKGQSAQQELAQEEASLKRLGAVETGVTTFGAGVLEPPTQVMIIRVGTQPQPGKPSASARGRRQGKGRKRRQPSE